MSTPTAAEPARRYPLLLDLAGRPVLVVGGGPVAARRAVGLLEAGAVVHVIAPSVCEDLRALAEAGQVQWTAREASTGDVAPAAGRWALVHTATGDPHVDAAIAARAEAHGIWCVRADRAEASAAHVPAVAHGPDGVQVAVSGGGDPGRARAVRNAIAALLAEGALPLRRTRPAPPSGISAPIEVATPPQTGPEPANAPRDGARIPEGAEADGGRGRVVLVGGGPGDPDLMTVAARQWLARADVVVTDRLAPTGVLADLDDDVEVIDVGKVAGNHPIPQEQINRILVEQAQRGRTVVRLKGGDPFVLGRGGEEAIHCLAHGVPVEVVPGVTSAVSVPASAGIPVTHRGVTTSLVIASAHAGAGNALDAARAAHPDATLVLLMGLSGLSGTAEELIAAGRDPRTPTAVISRGSTPEQRTVTAPLAQIARAVDDADLPGPAVIVVGEVVALRTRLIGLDRRAVQ